MHIIAILDTIADDLERKGFIKEAYDLDIIANTLEREAFTRSPKIQDIKKALMEAFRVSDTNPKTRLVEEFEELTPLNFEFFFFKKLFKFNIFSDIIKSKGYKETVIAPNKEVLYMPVTFNPSRPYDGDDPAVLLNIRENPREGGTLVYVSFVAANYAYKTYKSRIEVEEPEKIRIPEQVPAPSLSPQIT